MNTKELRYRDFVEKGYVIAGSPATVRQRLQEEVVKGLRVGNLMVLLQIGSMPHELTLQNMDLFAREVLPSLRGVGGRGLGQPLVAGEAPQRALERRGRGGEMSGLNGTQARTLSVWQNRVRMRVLSKGNGPALVFFHGPWGLPGIRFWTRCPSTSPSTPPNTPAPRPARPTTSITWTASGTWSSATTSCWSRWASRARPSWAIPSAPWSPARWPPPIPRRAGRLALIDPARPLA